MKKSIFLFLIIFICSCKEEIIHGIDEKDANRIIAHLNDSSISAEKKFEPAGTWSISVEKQYTIPAIKSIEASRIIRDGSINSNDKGSFVASREEQRFRHERGLSREIEKTLLDIPEVLDARVHLNQPLTDPILGKAISEGSGSGSVLLIVDAGRNVPREQIASLVSGASGISAEKISVVVAEERRDISQKDRALFREAIDSDNPGITDISISADAKKDPKQFLNLTLKEIRFLGMGALCSLILIILLTLTRKILLTKKLRIALQKSEV